MYGNGQVGGAIATPTRGWEDSAKAATNTQTATDRIRGELEGAINRVHTAIDRVRLFADSMDGGRPESGAIQKEAPERAGAMGKIQDRVDQLHASLSTLESYLERLTQI